MITPVFWIEQDDNSLFLKIRAPYAKISDTEIEYAEDIFVFSSAPYYLRIHLPRHVIDDGSGTTKYDCDSGEFSIVIPKLVKGEEFPDLEMITKLLKPEPSAKRLVEELPDCEESEDIDDENDDEFLFDQQMKDVSKCIRDQESCEYGYGFGWRRTGVIEQLREEIGNVFDLIEPEVVSISDRVQKCAEFDGDKFDPERYLCDTIDPDEELLRILSLNFASQLQLTDEDRTRLKDLPSRKLPRLTSAEEYSTHLALIDIIFGWCYDQRVNEWEECPESGWNIAHLSPTLSFLVKYNQLEEAVIGSARRSLCYPLYRSWDLAVKVCEDTKIVFSKGPSALLHILCDVHAKMVSSGEFRYLLNDLILTDLLIWIQYASKDLFEKINEQLQSIKLTKQSMGLLLDELELEGRMAMMKVDELDSDDEEVHTEQ